MPWPAGGRLLPGLAPVFGTASGHDSAPRVPDVQTLSPRAERVAARLRELETDHGRASSAQVRSKIEAHEARRAVAADDLGFTPVKSASLRWTLGSTSTRDAVEAAHHDAVVDTLTWLERETAFARTGDRGKAQIETRG
jgi:hypothetical protein